MLNFFKKVWDKIKSVAKAMWDGIKKFFKKALDFAKKTGAKVKGVFVKPKADENKAEPIKGTAKKGAPTPKQNKAKNGNKKSSQMHREAQHGEKVSA